jgi:hypothetical protein
MTVSSVKRVRVTLWLTRLSVSGETRKITPERQLPRPAMPRKNVMAVSVSIVASLIR